VSKQNLVPSGASDRAPVPRGNLAGLSQYFRSDLLSGFLVFLIALPLCLGISIASGFPPLAGIFTAIIGSIIATSISDSELTIKGPAAGLIVIVLGCVADFGGDGMTGGWTEADTFAYRAALAVGLVAALLQVILGMMRVGIIGDFFPSAVVHGMLAAIGVIIVLKQIPVALGVAAKGEPFELLRGLPHFIISANPAIAAIGITSMTIMFCWPLIGAKFKALKRVPSALVVLAVAIPMGMAADLLHQHSYFFVGHEYQIGEQYLVQMPTRVFGMFSEVTTPDFSALQQPRAWWWVFLFFSIGSLESLLSAKAVDRIDPYKRKSNLDRDLVAVGAANMVASLVGGLPMISEIVRSRSNIDNGAKTRFANLWHGIFLLLCVGLIPTILHLIPLAALASMLVYTGFRLAHPREFINVYKIGREQFLVFITTLIAVLATDLLVGVLIGIGVKFLLYVIDGVPLRSLFKPYLEVEPGDGNTCLIRARQSAVFSNWIPFRRELENVGLVNRQNITLDLSGTTLVDHNVMEKLHEMQGIFSEEGLELKLVGLEGHSTQTDHEMASRRGGPIQTRRLTIVAHSRFEPAIESICANHELFLFTTEQLHGRFRLGNHFNNHNSLSGENGHPLVHDPSDLRYVRVEAVGTLAVCDAIIDQLRRRSDLASDVAIYADAVQLTRLASVEQL
jgi:MFS superfamily sulfate permease-like transporter